jgi:lysozyme family protein
VIRDTEPGGAGNRGIAFERFKAWWHLQKRVGEPTFDDLKNQPQADADALYGKFFMDPCHFDDLPLGVDYVVLDGFINGGGLIILQHALGMKDDHPRSSITSSARSRSGARRIATRACSSTSCATCAARATPCSGSPTNRSRPALKTWEQVWNERTEVVRKRALAMVK